MTEITIAEVRITETGTPSRSKGHGSARIGTGATAVFATASGRTVSVDGPFEVAIVVELRRASGRTDKTRKTFTLVPESGASADLSAGSPQSYDVHVDNARLA